MVFFSGMIVTTQALLSDALIAAQGAAIARIQTGREAGVQRWDVYNSTGFEGCVLLE